MWLLIITSVLGFGYSSLFFKNNGLFKILILPALGLFVFTQLVLTLAFIFGVSYSSIFLALTLTAILSIFCFFKFEREFSLKNFSIPFIAITLLVTSFLAYIWLTQALAISGEGFKTGGGGMYGDSALHAAYTSRIETGEFPPQNPLFAGRTLVYPIANDLLSAVLKIVGLNFNLAFSLPQILFLVGFLTLFYQIVRKFTSNFGFVITLLILFLGWGVGFIYFFSEWQTSGLGPWQFLTKDYTDNSQYNLYFRNILTGLILPERSFLPGLFLGLLMFWNFLEYFKRRNQIFLIINGGGRRGWIVFFTFQIAPVLSEKRSFKFGLQFL